MQLDFTSLDKIAQTKQDSPAEDFSPLPAGRSYNRTAVAEKGTGSPHTQLQLIYSSPDPQKPRTATEGYTDAEIRQMLAEEEQQKKRTPAQQYQENIRRSGTLQSEILKGLAEGQNIYSLFLKAIEAIALMTNDNIIKEQAEGAITTVYGIGQGEEIPLQRELEATEKRLFNLEESLLWCETMDDQRRIERAIEAHRHRAEKLRELIAG